MRCQSVRSSHFRTILVFVLLCQLIGIIGYFGLMIPFFKIFKRMESFRSMRIRLMVYFTTFILVLVIKEIVMIVYTALDKKLLTKSFDSE